MDSTQSDLVYVFALRYARLSEADLIPRKSLIKSLGAHVKEHYPNAAYGVYPIEDDSKIALLVVANKYSPNNFWSVTSAVSLEFILTK